MPNLSEEKINEINNRILHVWNSLRPDEIERKPLLYYELKTNCALFIGGNPSFVPQGVRTILASHPELAEFSTSDERAMEFYAFKNYDKYNHLYRINFEAAKTWRVNKSAPYFDVFNEVIRNTGYSEWEHIDLFYMSETDQHEIKKLRKNPIYSRFFDEQVSITKDLIKLLEPEVIIVANAHSAKILKSSFNLGNIDDKLGTYLLEMNQKQIPVFFSSMLSGQRALDVESRIRLNWHLKYVKSDFR